MEFIKISVSILRTAAFYFMFGHQNLNRLLENGVSIVKFEENPMMAAHYISEINISPHKKHLFMTTFGGFPILSPENGLIDSKFDERRPKFVLNSSYDYHFWLLDKHLGFPSRSPKTVTRSWFKVSQPKTFYDVLLQVREHINITILPLIVIEVVFSRFAMRK